MEPRGSGTVRHRLLEYAIDLFEAQNLNVGLSGRGNQEIFEKHLEDFEVDKGANTVILTGDSTDTSCN
jgi:hypothetical protein